MQDKTIDSVLCHLHSECMNGRHDGLQLVLALMRLRGVTPTFRKLGPKQGTRKAQRLARRLTAPAPGVWGEGAFVVGVAGGVLTSAICALLSHFLKPVENQLACNLRSRSAPKPFGDQCI